MSAIAQYLKMQGKAVSGSDRSFNFSEADGDTYRKLASQGIALFPQDGSGIGANCSSVIVSTAIEASNPEIIKAHEIGLPILHRSDVLAYLSSQKKTIAVSGTSGKSTVTAMIFQILHSAGLKPSIISGAALNSLRSELSLGNAHYAEGEFLVIEADESDGSLIKYHPEIAVILNIDKDHKEISELLPLFSTFLSQVKNDVVFNREDLNCQLLSNELSHAHYNPSVKNSEPKPNIHWFSEEECSFGKVHDYQSQAWSQIFRLQDTQFQLFVPGRHNQANAMSALSTAFALGLKLDDCVDGLRSYSGIERRHVKIGEKNGITVIDDFAHNPAKIQASIRSTLPWCKRLIAIFHPHGFAPMKLLRKEIVEAFLETLRPQDEVYLPEIYYAGGTADKSISSRNLVDELQAKGVKAHYFADKSSLLNSLLKTVQEGDWVLSMGARDPSLAKFAEEIWRKLP